ncbi:MAG: DUF86 domain-containing protein [Methanolinea sp.]|nr:DUF86 domain-containing protein [Methanolinea sp.]
MKAPRQSIDYLNDIIGAIEKAEAFSCGMTIDEFLTDDKTLYATVRAIEIIGEASKHVPERNYRRLSRHGPGRAVIP